MIPDRYRVREYEIPSTDPRLGRNVAHDDRSRAFTGPLVGTGTTLATVFHRQYDPTPMPNQVIGNCTGCAEMMMANTVGNRRVGKVLTMAQADRCYFRATEIDGFDGTMPPEDTGSDGLHAAKASVEQGVGSSYRWYFGIDQVLRGLQLLPIAVGTVWLNRMFDPDPRTHVVSVDQSDEVAGGHEWLLTGYDARTRLVTGKCWWGPDFGYRGRFKTAVEGLEWLLGQDGDAHTTIRKAA